MIGILRALRGFQITLKNLSEPQIVVKDLAPKSFILQTL